MTTAADPADRIRQDARQLSELANSFCLIVEGVTVGDLDPARFDIDGLFEAGQAMATALLDDIEAQLALLTAAAGSN